MRLRGPESQLDWLAVALLWLGAFILAIREGHLPLIGGAPAFLASGVWNLVPLLLISAAIAIFIYRQLRPIRVPVTGEASVLLQIPNAEAKAITALKRARDGANIAIWQGTQTTRAAAYHELDAAMLTIENTFGIEPLKLPLEQADNIPLKPLLDSYINYVDRFYPLLREGHTEAAREKAAAFKNPWLE